MYAQSKFPRSLNILTFLFLILSVFLTDGIFSHAYAQGPNTEMIAASGQKPFTATKQLSFTEAIDMLDSDSRGLEYVLVTTRDGNAVSVLMKKEDGSKFKTNFPSQYAADRFLEQADKRGVNIRAVESSNRRPTSSSPSSGSGNAIFTTLLLLGGMFGIMWYFNNKNNPNAGGGGRGPKVGPGFGRSPAKKFEADSENKKTFADVAGQDEAKAELEELVGFLKNRALLDLLGGKPAKGVLLIGPPGTGKTLLARAVAGEAGADFFPITGSDFVQMFVGVGASRVRDLFEQAAKSKKAIIFIDEIDAVGRQRGSGMSSNDEREQTLNQLLAEMDGFKSSSNIIVMAATNRADVLDPALLRPGRFDMQVLVDNPDITGRHEILKVHTKNKPLAPEVDLELIAKNTTGMSGAQLEGAANQAATIAFRRLMKIAEGMTAKGISDEEIRDSVEVIINMDDFDEGIDRVLMGPKNDSRGSRMSAEDKKNTAVHEAGHAWMANLAYRAGWTRDPVTKITIVPRARALGYMIAQPELDTYSHPREYLLSRIMIAMGGRAAQEVLLGVSDGGAQNDFEQAWNIANQMVAKFGMSRLGIISIGQASNPFLGAGGNGTAASSQLQYEIECEVRRILNECYQETVKVLERDKKTMQPLIDRLFERETVLGPEFNELVEGSA